MIPFLFFWIQGALGLMSISLRVIDLMSYEFLLNFNYFNLIFGKQKDSLNEIDPIFSGG